MRHPDAAFDRLIGFFEGLQPADLDQLDAVYAEGAHFRDPFNDVTGIDAIRRIFEHMFATTTGPAFTVHHAVRDGDVGYLHWRFDFGAARRAWVVDGLTRVVLDASGRVVEHVDYWDPAAQLYEHLPVAGRLFAWLRRRLAA